MNCGFSPIYQQLVGSIEKGEIGGSELKWKLVFVGLSVRAGGWCGGYGEGFGECT